MYYANLKNQQTSTAEGKQISCSDVLTVALQHLLVHYLNSMFEERKRELEEVKVVFRQYASITHVKDVRQQPSKLMNLFDAKCAIISLTGMDDDQIPLKSLKAQLSLIRKNFGERETTVVERTGRTSAINLIEFYHLYRHYKEKQLLISCCASATLLEANNSCRNEGSSIALFDVQILYPHIDKRGKGWVTKDQIDQV